MEAAQKEGIVTWYVSIPDEPVQAVANAFEQEYGIAVEVVRMGSPVVAQRYSTERDAGQAVGDLVTIPEAHVLDEYLEKGWIRELPADQVENMADWPEEALHKDAYFLSTPPSAWPTTPTSCLRHHKTGKTSSTLLRAAMADPCRSSPGPS